MTFPSPNYTQTPNELFDLHMATMTGAELKVVMAAVRKTVGFHKKRETISISQFQQMTGLSRRQVITTIDSVIDKGFIKEVGTGKRGAKRYELAIQSNELTSQESRPETSAKIAPVLVQKMHQSNARTSAKIAPTKESIKETPKKKDAPVFGPFLTDDQKSDVVTMYEHIVGPMPEPMQGMVLLDLAEAYSFDWLEDALKEAVANNAERPIPYAREVLNNWRKKGRSAAPVVPKKPNVNNGSFVNILEPLETGEDLTRGWFREAAHDE